MKFDINILENVPLAELTTLEVGGAARFFVRAESENDVAEAFRFAEKNDLDLFILGGGSNVVIADDGFDGFVLQIGLKGIEISGDLVSAQAGEDWDALCESCVEQNLAGIECLSGIPGFVGGTPVQNVGAYGQEVSETIISVRAFDRKTKDFIELSNQQCGFSYRKSIFNSTARDRYIVLSVSYRLIEDGEPKIVYADLIKYFNGKQPTLGETRDAVIEIRAAKSMVIRSDDPNRRSVGSFFKNPIVSNKKFAEIAEKAATETVPSFKIDEGSVKIPAAWLIENSGFDKGFQKGNVGLSTRHTLAIVNRGGATAKDIAALRDEIQVKVKERFGVELKPEPVFVGFN